MILTRLDLEQFRSYATLVWRPEPGVNLVVGENGSGKTNLLEAVALLAGLRLRPVQTDLDMVREGATGLRVVGTMAPDPDREMGATTHTIAVAVAGRLRRYQRDAVPARAGAEGTPTVVAFTPDDLEIVKGGPEIRRRLLERDLGQVSLHYRDLQRRFGRVLAQRNALLRAIADGRSGEGELRPWDEAVAEIGSAVQRWRAQTIAALAPAVADAYRRVAAGRGTLVVRYRPRTAPAGGEAAAGAPAPGDREALLQALRASRAVERVRGHTLVGPHRDDLAFELDGRDMRGFASQGEQRTAVVCVKVSILEHLRATREDRPLLVLDDVLSELDRGRQERLLAVAKGYQTFVSSTFVPPGVHGAAWRTGGGGLEAWPADGRMAVPDPNLSAP
jgi:DNA replication and repair protein RecF